jgi:phosphoglycerate dehydrogenase-like enzyme
LKSPFFYRLRDIRLKSIAMIGSYSAEVIPIMEQKKPAGFELTMVPSYEEYAGLTGADYIVLRSLKIDAEVIKTLKKTRLIHRWGAGFDTVDIKAAGLAGISVAITAGVNSTAVSEHAILLILALYRHIVTFDNMIKRGEWERQSFIDRSFMIKGKTLGLFGCGNIGSLVAQKAVVFGANVIYYDINRMSLDREKELGIKYVDIDTLLSLSDIISVHIPAGNGTKGIFNKTFFNKMKPSAIFINTARGSIVDEADLAEALRQGVIAGAGIDAFAVEPLPTGSPVVQCKNVILTPHVGGNTRDINIAMIEKILENIAVLERGGSLSPPDLVNGQFLKRE